MSLFLFRSHPITGRKRSQLACPDRRRIPPKPPERRPAGGVLPSDPARPKPAPTEAAMKIRDVMSRDVRLVSPHQTIQEAARLMEEIDAGALPVGENDRIVGMITDRDITIR